MKVEYVSLSEAQSIKRKVQNKVVAEYVTYLEKLPEGQAGKIIAGKDEKANTIRNRLVRAKKSLGVNDIAIKRVGDTVLFWREQQLIS